MRTEAVLELINSYVSKDKILELEVAAKVHCLHLRSFCNRKKYPKKLQISYEKASTSLVSAREIQPKRLWRHSSCTAATLDLILRIDIIDPSSFNPS